MAPEKNMAILIHAYALARQRLMDARGIRMALLVVGRADSDGYLRSLRAVAAQLGVLDGEVY